eukprot:m.126683 g.126683  ORF g.126683 m.126683 type:complete len:126 (-) comp16345_c1_seq3:884-1261(-)
MCVLHHLCSSRVRHAMKEVHFNLGKNELELFDRDPAVSSQPISLPPKFDGPEWDTREYVKQRYNLVLPPPPSADLTDRRIRSSRVRALLQERGAFARQVSFEEQSSLWFPLLLVAFLLFLGIGLY